MVECFLSEIILNTLAQEAGEVEENEYSHCCDQNQGTIQGDEVNQGVLITGNDRFINHSLRDEGCVGINYRHCTYGD